MSFYLGSDEPFVKRERARIAEFGNDINSMHVMTCCRCGRSLGGNTCYYIDHRYGVEYCSPACRDAPLIVTVKAKPSNRGLKPLRMNLRNKG